MRLGNLFKAVVKTTVELPISIVKDVFIGVPRIADGKNLYSKDKGIGLFIWTINRDRTKLK